ncbi:MAG: chaperone NapD [Chromatiales bacterium]|nr:chaperone NapD [Gammaproteobacteria bacterium]MCP5352979.1 chaperone NapD [Chromatiales bacterium]
MSTISIVGVLVHAKPGRLDAVRAGLLALPGVEIHEVTEDGRLIVIAEEQPEGQPGDRLSRTVTEINNVPGVINASMIYQHSETEESGDAAQVA